MSKLLANWELTIKDYNKKISSIIELIKNSRKIFLVNPNLAFAANRVVIKNVKNVDLNCDDFLLYLLANDKNEEVQYWDFKNFFEHFFEKTLPMIFENFNSFQISQNDYINLLSNDNVTLLYLEKKPITNIFSINNLKLPPFSYSKKEIEMIKRLILFINSQNNNSKILTMNFFSFYFFSFQNKKKALATQINFLEKINNKINFEKLEIHSMNYGAIIKKIKE